MVGVGTGMISTGERKPNVYSRGNGNPSFIVTIYVEMNIGNVKYNENSILVTKND